MAQSLNAAKVPSSQSLGRQWFVLQTEWQAEAPVAKAAADLGAEIFLPLEQREVRHARRIETKTFPMISGYVFTRFDLLADAGRWEKIGTMKGAVRFLGLRVWDDGVLRPAAVRAGQVERLIGMTKALANIEGQKTELFPVLTEKTRVLIHSGILANFSGTVIYDRRGNVLLNLDKQFGGRPVSVPRESVRARA